MAIAAKAVEIATKRHCGTKEEIYTSNGLAYLQKGKDLTQIKNNSSILDQKSRLTHHQSTFFGV